MKSGLLPMGYKTKSGISARSKLQLIKRAFTPSVTAVELFLVLCFFSLFGSVAVIMAATERRIQDVTVYGSLTVQSDVLAYIASAIIVITVIISGGIRKLKLEYDKLETGI